MSIPNNSRIAVTTQDDILRCSTLSSLLEVAGWPKPGNIHRTQDFTDTRYEHFLAAIAGIQPEVRKFTDRVESGLKSQENDFSYVKLGEFFKAAAEHMMRWQEGGNVILGHILILGPLIASAVICVLRNTPHINHFEKTLEKIIEDATVQDTINLYKAINTCNPGGLGSVSKYDLTDRESINQLREDRIALKRIFELSQDYDLISREYATGFEIILMEGLPFYFEVFNQTDDVNIATVHTFLKILANHPDTLIARKSGEEMAQNVSERAATALELGGLETPEGREMLREMDKSLQQEDGKLNPGTSADLLVGVIFCALIFGLTF